MKRIIAQKMENITKKMGGPARAHKGKGLKKMFFLFKMIGRDACPGRR
jgi:hypothetical protein